MYKHESIKCVKCNMRMALKMNTNCVLTKISRSQNLIIDKSNKIFATKLIDAEREKKNE